MPLLTRPAFASLCNRNGNAAAKSKIHPPRLDGGKVGLFATRTPHRPNPIGLSLVRLERVEGIPP